MWFQTSKFTSREPCRFKLRRPFFTNIKCGIRDLIFLDYIPFIIWRATNVKYVFTSVVLSIYPIHYYYMHINKRG
jgi:hypothetical protein